MDLFLPSLDELLAMMSIPKGPITRALLHQVSGQLLDMGAAIVLLKLGDQGLFLRTTPDPQRLSTLGRALAHQATPEAWLGCEMDIPYCAILSDSLVKADPQGIGDDGMANGHFCHCRNLFTELSQVFEIEVVPRVYPES